MMKLRILFTLFALTLAFNLFARFAGVYYDGVHYFINIDQGWAAFESYSKSKGWKDFFKIENDLEVIEVSEISDIKIEKKSNIKVFSVNGNLVFEGSSEQFKKAMESLPSGIYIINSGNVTKKFRVK